MRRDWLAGALAVVAGLTAPAATSAAGSAEVSVTTEAVCFSVHPPGDPIAREVFGTRYHVGRVTPAHKAIVLVHGVSTRSIWDFREDFSVARNLARAGYVVIAYDQLGFGDSPYELPQGGRALTLQASRSMLHEVVGQVRAGDYGVDGTCSSGAEAQVGLDDVILVGHSGGAAIVSGYAGQYGDVAAVAQVAWSHQGMNPRFFLPGGGAWNAARQGATGNEYVYLFLDDEGQFNRSQCETFALYEQGVDRDIRGVFCGEPHIGTIAMPAGWLYTSPSVFTENPALITRVEANLPVLLVWPEFDWLFSAAHREAEHRYWREHCRCDVTVWTQPDAKHAFAVHRSMPAFTETVVEWLRSKGL